jgi:hypothetical protein
MMPLGGPEPMGRIAFSPDEASPSRARLGRVAAMLREAEEAPLPTSRRDRHDPDGAAVVPAVRRRPRPMLPAPRRAVDDVLTARRAGSRV